MYVWVEVFVSMNKGLLRSVLVLKQGYVQLSTYFATTVVQILVKLNWANPLHKIYIQNEGSKKKVLLIKAEG